MKIHVQVDSGPVQRALQRLGERAANLGPAFREMGEGVKADAQQRFKASQDPYGKPWQRLKAATIAARRKGKGDGQAKPLLDTGRLRNSIASQAGANSVQVGTNLAYAAIHQFGGVINFAQRSLRVRLRQVKVTREDGTTYMATRFAKDKHKRAVAKWGTSKGAWLVRIPARPYFGVQDRGLPREYGEIIRDALARYFGTAAQGGGA